MYTASGRVNGEMQALRESDEGDEFEDGAQDKGGRWTPRAGSKGKDLLGVSRIQNDTSIVF